MIKSIQIKIVLIFLILGLIIIATMGYINYMNLQVVARETIGINEQSAVIVQNMQEKIMIITVSTMLLFTLICILVGIFISQKIEF